MDTRIEWTHYVHEQFPWYETIYFLQNYPPIYEHPVNTDTLSGPCGSRNNGVAQRYEFYS